MIRSPGARTEPRMLLKVRLVSRRDPKVVEFVWYSD
jgi:hypothetical protein